MDKNKQILSYVKTHSPKKFAQLIRKRCQVTLQIVQKLKGMSISKRNKYRHPDTLIAKLVAFGQLIKIGCPHCGSCAECLWTKAYVKIEKPLNPKSKKNVCTDIKFGEVSWGNVFNFIRLMPHDIYVKYYDNFTKKDNFTLPVYKKAITFLQEHINWANEDGWGKDYKS